MPSRVRQSAVPDETAGYRGSAKALLHRENASGARAFQVAAIRRNLSTIP
jgi:hypothetical protein